MAEDKKIVDWLIASPNPAVQSQLSVELAIHPITAQLLINRGVDTVEKASAFLRPDLAALPDPFELPGIDRAVDIIIATLAVRQPFAIYGDYDVDGVAATALLARFFRSLGHAPLLFIPHRIRDGYGLTKTGINELARQGTKLIITVDNGMGASDDIRYAKKLGIDVIVTDHHAGEPPADAVSVINPRLGPSTFAHLCGTGVAFLLAMALRKRLRDAHLMRSEPNLKALLDIVGVATIADIVPLAGINRILATFGIGQLRQRPSAGLQALMKISGTRAERIGTGAIGFGLAPRLNAAGRMEDARVALELLLTDDPVAAQELSTTLDRLNTLRQHTEEKVFIEALAQAESQHDAGAIVVAAAHWHPGVIGIVAAKLAERFAKPAAVIAGSGDQTRGSVRSIPGLNVIELLNAVRQSLIRFGGHAQAAGLTIATESITAFRESFACATTEQLKKIPKRQLNVDAEVHPADVTDQLAQEIERFEPFGLGNPEPILCAHGFTMIDQRIVGGRHLKCRAVHPAATFEAIGFNLATTTIDRDKPCSIAFCPQLNEWNGTRQLQLKIRGLAPAGTFLAF